VVIAVCVVLDVDVDMDRVHVHEDAYVNAHAVPFLFEDSG
jgi:hypothetical protein